MRRMRRQGIKMKGVLPKICRFPGCGCETVAKVLCRTHYYQDRNGKPLTAIKPKTRRKGRQCSFKGCTRPAEGRGYCTAHRAQLYRG